MSEILFAVRDVSRRYRRGGVTIHALDSVSLEIPSGELVAIEGPSGSGKTTLLQLLGALDRPDEGAIVFEGRELQRLGDRELGELRLRAFGFVFQQFNLIPTLTALENVEAVLAPAGLGDDAMTEAARALLEEVGLGERAAHLPSHLSGGEQQRVAIARALVSRPTVVFADEPTGNLDSTTSGEILELMRDSVESFGQTTVMVTHDARAAAIADRILFLDDGLIVRDMPRSDQHDVVSAMEELAAR